MYIRKALKNRKRLVASRYSLRGARFAKYRFLNLHILHFRCFIPCLGLKSSLHRVVYMKTVEESEEISCISLQSSKRSFRKIQIFKFPYSALPSFYSLFRLSHRRIGLLRHWICSFQYMIIHFVSFRFAKYSKPLRNESVFHFLLFTIFRKAVAYFLRMEFYTVKVLDNIGPNIHLFE